MDLPWRQQIWLHQVAYLACNNAVKTIQNHRQIVHELQLEKKVNLGNKPINIICRMGMVTCLHSSQFQILRTFINILHSTWHTVRNQPPVQAKDFQVMGHSGNNMTSTKVVMAGLKCSPLCRFQDKGPHLQVHWECLQDCRTTIQSIGQHLPSLILHLNLLPVHPGDHRLASQWKHSSCLQNRRTQMSQGLLTSLHCRWFPMTIMMQKMRAIIRWTWAVQKANCQSASSKLNSPGSNLTKRWGRLTTVRSTSGRKYGWLGFWRRSIGPLSRGRTVWNSFKMDPCTGRQQLQILWWQSRTGCDWIISIMMNGFGRRGLRCFE